MTLQELLNRQAALDQQINALREADRARAITEIQSLVVQYGLTAGDISAATSSPRKLPAKTAGKKVAAKYRHPITGATWTGRGLKPKWLTEELNAGKAMSEFSV